MDRIGDLDRTTFHLMASLQRLTARLFSGQREAGEVYLPFISKPNMERVKKQPGEYEYGRQCILFLLDFLDGMPPSNHTRSKADPINHLVTKQFIVAITVRVSGPMPTNSMECLPYSVSMSPVGPFLGRKEIESEKKPREPRAERLVWGPRLCYEFTKQTLA